MYVDTMVTVALMNADRTRHCIIQGWNAVSLLGAAVGRSIGRAVTVIAPRCEISYRLPRDTCGRMRVVSRGKTPNDERPVHVTRSLTVIQCLLLRRR